MRRALARLCELKAYRHLRVARERADVSPETLLSATREVHLALAEIWFALAHHARGASA